MRPLFRFASSLLILAASSASAGVIQQDGVVFTSTYTGNVLTLEIDAAKRSGGWASASMIDALSLKTIGSFSGVTMTSSNGTPWSLSSGELYARGCGASKGGSTATSLSRLCYTGPGIALADNMVFTFTFTGTPALSAPHLKVHFVDARGSKVGSLLSLDFPAQAASTPIVTSPAPAPAPAPVATAPELIPPPPVTLPVKETAASDSTLPAGTNDLDEDAADVPEPETLPLLAAGFAMLGLVRRRRK